MGPTQTVTYAIEVEDEDEGESVSLIDHILAGCPVAYPAPEDPIEPCGYEEGPDGFALWFQLPTAKPIPEAIAYWDEWWSFAGEVEIQDPSIAAAMARNSPEPTVIARYRVRPA